MRCTSLGLHFSVLTHWSLIFPSTSAPFSPLLLGPLSPPVLVPSPSSPLPPSLFQSRVTLVRDPWPSRFKGADGPLPNGGNCRGRAGGGGRGWGGRKGVGGGGYPATPPPPQTRQEQQRGPGSGCYYLTPACVPRRCRFTDG